MITRTKKSSTRPWTKANAGPDGGLPGASAVNAGIKDVREAIVTRERAEAVYGVVFQGDGSVAEAETSALRASLRVARENESKENT